MTLWIIPAGALLGAAAALLRHAAWMLLEGDR